MITCLKKTRKNLLSGKKAQVKEAYCYFTLFLYVPRKLNGYTGNLKGWKEAKGGDICGRCFVVT